MGSNCFLFPLYGPLSWTTWYPTVLKAPSTFLFDTKVMRRVPAPTSTPLSRRFSVQQGWSQLSREPRYSAQSWADSSSHMLPFHPKLAGNIITLSLIVLLVCRFFYSVLFLHTWYYLLSIFQKLLKITVYWHKPTISYLSVSITEAFIFHSFSFFGGGGETWWSEAMFWTGSCEFTSHLFGLRAQKARYTLYGARKIWESPGTLNMLQIWDYFIGH